MNRMLQAFVLGGIFLSSQIYAKESCLASLRTLIRTRANSKSPIAAKEFKGTLLRPNSKILSRLARDPEFKLSYIVDLENQVYFFQGSLNFPNEKTVFFRHLFADAAEAQIPVKEAGRIEFLNSSKSFKLIPEYEPLDLAEEEIALIRASAEESGEVVGHRLQGVARAKMMNCQKIFEAQKSGKSFIWDQFLTSNALLTLSIASHNKDRFFDVENYDILISDYVSTNQHTLIRSFTGRYMMLNGMGYGKRLAGRMGIGLGSTEIQGWTSQFILKDKDGKSGEEKAEQITAFNRLWLVPSLLKSDALDKFVLGQLPEISYNLCLKGSPLRIVASPKMIRFMEGWLSSTIYFTLREKYLAQEQED